MSYSNDSGGCIGAIIFTLIVNGFIHVPILTAIMLGIIVLYFLCIYLNIQFKEKKLRQLQNLYPHAYDVLRKKFNLAYSKDVTNLTLNEIKMYLSISPIEWEKINNQEQIKIYEQNKYYDIFKKYPDGLSYYKSQNTNSTIKEINSNINLIIQYDIKQKELKKKLMFDKKNSEEKRIKEELQQIKTDFSNSKIEKAQKKLIEIRSFVQNSSHSSNNEIITIIQNEEESISNSYNDGVIDNYGILRVDYKTDFDIQDGFYWEYPVVKYPEYNNIVFPYRRRNIARRGYCEKFFQDYLEKVLHNNELLIIGDCNILPANNNRPYEPDIAIICETHPSIRIDIEIDEPYAAISNKPIHYIECGDDFRDTIINNIGWIVIRFTEFQVYNNPKGCTAFIAQTIKHIQPSINFPADLLTYALPQKIKRWTEIESKVQASEKTRQHYLNHDFGFMDEELLTNRDITQTEIEKECAKLIKPIEIIDKPIITNRDLDNFNHRDEKIQFRAYEHIYLYQGNTILKPASNIISYFFKPFDSDYWASYKADQRRIPTGKILEEWDIKGCISKEVGTFMHKQIEGFYKGYEFQTQYKFTYNGKYYQLNEDISIETEKEQFINFYTNHQFQPYRTEWTIYDDVLEIAGTIDMVYKNEDGTIDIYDWKRSSRIVTYTGEPISINYYGDKGIRGLNQIEDTPYWHYCIQQNLYKYILENNYDIKVNKMHLVNFSVYTNDYTKLEVPNMDDTITIIINALRHKII